jgi:hypothetical protein
MIRFTSSQKEFSMQPLTPDLRPGLEYACEWLRQSMGEHPVVAESLRAILDSTPALSSKDIHQEFEDWYWSEMGDLSPSKNRQSLFHRKDGAYIDPDVLGAYVGWCAKAKAVRDRVCETAPDVSLTGWSYTDGDLKACWSKDHPVESHLCAEATNITAISLSDFSRFGVLRKSESELMDLVDRAKTSVIIHALMRFQAVKDKDGRTPCEALVDYNNLVKLLYEMMGHPIPEHILNGGPEPERLVAPVSKSVSVSRRTLSNALEILTGVVRRKDLAALVAVDHITPVIAEITKALEDDLG